MKEDVIRQLVSVEETNMRSPAGSLRLQKMSRVFITQQAVQHRQQLIGTHRRSGRRRQLDQSHWSERWSPQDPPAGRANSLTSCGSGDVTVSWSTPVHHCSKVRGVQQTQHFHVTLNVLFNNTHSPLLSLFAQLQVKNCVVISVFQ